MSKNTQKHANTHVPTEIMQTAATSFLSWTDICRQLPEYIEQIRVSLVDKCPAILVPLACEDRRRDETHLARSVLLQHGLEGVF